MAGACFARDPSTSRLLQSAVHVSYRPSTLLSIPAPVTRKQRLTSVAILPVQVVGYCGRIWSHYDEMSIGGFVIQAMLILVAPALYAASIYMILGRLIRAVHAEHLSIIPVRWMTKIFVAGDVVAFVLQAGGGGIQAAGTLELYEIGEKIIIVGLFVQICIFSFFLFTSLDFHRRQARQAGTTKSARQTSPIPWKRHLYVLYVTSALILFRSVFRVIEYLQGNRGHLNSYEIYLYIFDAVLMFAVMVIFAIWYIGDLEQKMYPIDESAGESTDLTTFIRSRGSRDGQAVEAKSMV